MNRAAKVSRGPTESALLILTGYVMCCAAAFVCMFVVVLADVLSIPRTTDASTHLIERAVVNLDRVVKP